MGMALERVNTATGEVIPAAFDATAYLASLSKRDGIGTQKALAAAYDEACAALVGPNDVQIEGTRSFKKKSAWRKLARYFNISVEVVRVERDVLESGHFLSTVTARATAPWGQSYEEVGACCTDEATGRRVITVADAIATASTRASNRAVSNLIAMGEVSAEEIGDRPSHGSQPARASSQGGDAPARSSRPASSGQASGDPAAFVMPFGKTKGTPLGQMDRDDLQNAVGWARSKGKFAEFVEAASAVLAHQSRADAEDRGASSPADDPSFPPEPLHDDDLPF